MNSYNTLPIEDDLIVSSGNYAISIYRLIFISAITCSLDFDALCREYGVKLDIFE